MCPSCIPRYPQLDCATYSGFLETWQSSIQQNADSRPRIGIAAIGLARRGEASEEPELRLFSLVLFGRNPAPPNPRGHTLDLTAPHVWQSRHLRAYDTRSDR